jgi:hypothetical protein
MESHVRILAILNIAWGSLGIIAALILMLVFGGVISLVGISAMQDADAVVAAPILGIVGTVVIVIILIVSLPGVIAGIGLLNFRPWARILTLVVSALHLLNVPFGTALGIYGFWVLLSSSTEALFQQGQGRPVAPYPPPPPPSARY